MSRDLPPIPHVDGILEIDVVYPSEGSTLSATDSTFIFGNVGTGSAELTIDGNPVEVHPNGAFLGFLPIPADGVYRLVARSGNTEVTATRTVRLPTRGYTPPTPVDDAEEASPDAPQPDSPRMAVVASDRADGMAIGTARPGPGTPYHWFFPNGTLLTVTGEERGEYRVRLTSDLEVWVSTSQLDLLPVGTPTPDGWVATVSGRPAADHIDIRLDTSDRLPFRVDGSERGLAITVYGARSRTNVLGYGADDPLLHRLSWEQPATDLYRVNVELSEPLWGWTSFYDSAGRLVVRIRRPPVIDPDRPLQDLLIAVDAGHPPGGAIGPTRLTEAEANLAIAKQLIPMLEDAGARVLETRPDTQALGLAERTQMAEERNAHLLVSIHNDAFADGINPFLNAGTHVFYNSPQSMEFARSVHRRLLAALGLRDLGISRRDLALVRPTWMPSILTESAFMMIPQNEAALRDSEIQERIARAHLQGIVDFVVSQASSQR